MATRETSTHDVVHCNYCGSGMSVPVDNIPDDPKCNSCERHHNRETWDKKAHCILTQSPIDDGDWVWYDGREWRATHLHDQLMKLERLNPDDASENVEKWGVDVRNLIPKADAVCGDCGAVLPGRADVDLDSNHVPDPETEPVDVSCLDCGFEVQDAYVAYALARTVVYQE